MGRDIKYRQPIRNRDNSFKEWVYWGCIKDSPEWGIQWISPYIHGSGIDTREESLQFTGLQDKNGVDIYEGDLLIYPLTDTYNYTVFEVFFHDNDSVNDHIGFVMNRTHMQGNITGCYIPQFLPKNTKKMEVVGNIYQNPELLK